MTTVKDVCGNYQYADRELCERWNNNIPASAFYNEDNINTVVDDSQDDDDDFTLDSVREFIDDSQEIESLCEYFSFLPKNDIMAAIVTIRNGNYKEVYVTESSRYYGLLSAIYHPLDYYIE